MADNFVPVLEDVVTILKKIVARLPKDFPQYENDVCSRRWVFASDFWREPKRFFSEPIFRPGERAFSEPEFHAYEEICRRKIEEMFGRIKTCRPENVQVTYAKNPSCIILPPLEEEVPEELRGLIVVLYGLNSKIAEAMIVSALVLLKLLPYPYVPTMDNQLIDEMLERNLDLLVA